MKTRIFRIGLKDHFTWWELHAFFRTNIKFRFAALLLFLIGLLLSACTGGVSALPAATDLQTGETATLTTPAPPVASTTTTPEGQTSQPPSTESAGPTVPAPPSPLSEYDLTARLDYDAHHLSVNEEINYVNHTGEALNELLLVVEPNHYPGGFSLGDLAWTGGETITDYTLEGAQLKIPLNAPLDSEASIALSLSYETEIPNQQAPFGYSERQTNLGDWYAFVPPYRPGEGWVARDSAYLGEHVAYEMADFRVDIQLANPNNQAGQPLIVAASALPEIDGEHYRFQHGPARNFAWTVSHLYQEQETRAGEVIVKAYSFPGHPASDEPAMETAAQALDVFSQIYSPYPHKSLTVVEADFLDGMEFDGMFFLSHAFYDYFTGDAKNNLIIISAHETAHQWWYGLVGDDQALEPWLDEALSTYSEALFYERAHPDLKDWWWENRIYFHQPQGWVDTTIYQAAGFYPYRDAVYLRGALFLQELRDRMGDEAFFGFLKDYLYHFMYGQATTDGFFNLLSEHYSGDISDILQSYFSNR